PWTSCDSGTRAFSRGTSFAVGCGSDYSGAAGRDPRLPERASAPSRTGATQSGRAITPTGDRQPLAIRPARHGAAAGLGCREVREAGGRSMKRVAFVLMLAAGAGLAQQVPAPVVSTPERLAAEEQLLQRQLDLLRQK